MTVAEVIGVILFSIIVVWPLLTYVGDVARYLLKKARGA